MTVILHLVEGTKLYLDRNLRTTEVAAQINAAREGSTLLEFPDNNTPSRRVWVDPAHVLLITDDR